ncbi:hypothetical protein NFI96_030577, partial [Prochilodus magdalenae]
YTGYCWCVTPNGRPISGSAVANKKPRCQGPKPEKVTPREPGKTVSLQIFSILNADESPGLVMDSQPAAEEEEFISQYPTLWTEQVRSRQNRTRTQSSSCDQEQLTAQEEARQLKNEAVFVPECAQGGLYKPVQCHPSTGYCWCVLVDTGRPIPGTSTRYEQPKCDGNARAHPNKPKDHYRSRHLQGCPGAKKREFLTSVLDALSTDMVHAVTDPAAAGR